MVIQIKSLKYAKAREISKRKAGFYANKLISCSDIGVKFEVVERSCISYTHEAFQLRFVEAKTEGPRRLLKGHT